MKAIFAILIILISFPTFAESEEGGGLPSSLICKCINNEKDFKQSSEYEVIDTYLIEINSNHAKMKSVSKDGVSSDAGYFSLFFNKVGGFVGTSYMTNSTTKEATGAFNLFIKPVQIGKTYKASYFMNLPQLNSPNYLHISSEIKMNCFSNE